MHFHPSLIKPLALAVLLAGYPSGTARADSVKPEHSGPFFQNQLSFAGSPTGYKYVLPNGFYHFHVGWLEPFSDAPDKFFGKTYFETNGNLNVSPFTTDLGTTFNLKPFRYLEFGLSYNRMVFHNSMVAFGAGNEYVSKDQFRPDSIFSKAGEVPGGADIFSYQANLTFDIWRAQLYLHVSRAQWDIDAKGKQFVYEYGSEFLISTHDRINTVLGQINLDTRPFSHFKSFSYLGISVRDQYWWTDHSILDKNLVSAGISGMRLGRNTARQRRGLDFFVGYWIQHHQIPKGNVAESFMVILDWKWNIQVLKM